MTAAKSYEIPKRLVWEAYQQVKANHGVAGVDEQSLSEFERDIGNNLYRIWNRMSSGSYFPPPVMAVAIPKKSGGERILGIPTVSDRIAQAVVKLVLEPEIDPCFHPDSYGYRPGKSAHQAIEVTRKRCWWHDWVIEFDIRGSVRQHRSSASDEGGSASYGLQMGSSLYRAMAYSADAKRGWGIMQAGPGHTTGWRHFSAACKPVSPLCIRPLDGYSLSEGAFLQIR
jgi:RNA-directed DNA polymerase